MGIREAINQRGNVVMASSVVITILALAFIWRDVRAGAVATGTKAWFTDDDGKTWFLDDARNLPPYQRDGKTAVRCVVFKSDKGTGFVAYEEELPEAVRSAYLDTRPGQALPPLTTDDFLVKRPGDPTWVPLRSKSGSEILKDPRSPDGSASATPLVP